MEGAFRDAGLTGVEIIETFARDASGSLVRWPAHRARMAATARRLGYPFDDRSAGEVLAGVTGTGPLRLRLALGADGRLALTSAPLVPNPPLWRLRLSGTRLDPVDPWLGVKTTRRATYDAARAALPEGVDEWLFLNDRDELCEGTITNVFLETEAGLVTPHPGAGLLPGILRGELLARGVAREARLTPRDLAGARAVWVGNSLRGLILAVMAEP